MNHPSICVALLGLSVLSSHVWSAPAPQPARYAVAPDGGRPQPRVVATEVCAWPAMAKLPDGTLLVVNYNRPSHGRMVGDVDCWASTDLGQTWVKRGTAAPHAPGTKSNRMNVAFGSLPGGEALLIASGWSLKPDGKGADGLEIDQVLRLWVSRSADGGKTWKIDREAFPDPGPAGGKLIPFGPIQAGKSGDLLVPVYENTWDEKTGKSTWQRVYVYRSPDLGKTWTDPVQLDPNGKYNETALLHAGDGRWLAFARADGLTTYESTDDGRSWARLGPASERNCLPANAIKLADGTIVLSYGNRTRGDPRVEARLSRDAGRTWSNPVRLVDVGAVIGGVGVEDMGYPSSLELPDGRIITAYYAKRASYHEGYHLAMVTWDPARSFANDASK